MNGYMGKILRVDLSTGELHDEPLNEEYTRAVTVHVGAKKPGFSYIEKSTCKPGIGNPRLKLRSALRR